MSFSMNKVMLIGYVGRDPEYQVMPSGDKLCKISLATSRSWKDSSGNRVERTTWHNVVADERRFANFLPHIVKGKCLYIEGSIDKREWTDQGGAKHYIVEIRADRMEFAGGNNGQARGDTTQTGRPQQSTGTSEGMTGAANGSERSNTRPAGNTATATQEKTAAVQTGDSEEFTNFDNDIPF